MMLPIQPRTGVVKDDTRYSSRGRWTDMDQMRFQGKRLETRRGYEALIADTVEGKCRGGHTWNDFAGQRFAAFGTHSHLYALRGATLTDITPAEVTTDATLSDPFNTSSGDETVTVNHVAHGRVVGDMVYFWDAATEGGISAGGLLIFGAYIVATVPTADTYTFEHPDAAASTETTVGGTVSYRFFRGALGTDPFAVVDTDNTVTVTHTAHGRAVGDRVIFAGATAGGGITISGEYEIATVPNANSYTIEHSTPATSTDSTTGGAGVRYTYPLKIGLASTTGSSGYGTGGYGTGGYGASSAASGPSLCRVWFMGDINGKLYAVPRDGTLYEWPADTTLRAYPVPNAPARITSMFTTKDPYIVCLGCTDLDGEYNPMGVRHNSLDAPLTWTPAAVNSSRFIRLGLGSRIVGGAVYGKDNIILTDTAAYAQRPAYETIFDYELMGTGCGLIASRAVVGHNGVAYWWGVNGNFYRTSGGVPEEIECPVSDHAGDLLAAVQAEKIQAYVLGEFGEVLWNYPDRATSEVAYYVALNTGIAPAEDAWTIGTDTRTHWMDRGVWSYPITVTGDGAIQYGEKGRSANGGMVSRYALLAPLELGEGERVMNVRRFVPDFQIDGGTVLVSLPHSRWPNQAEITKGPYSVTAATEYVDLMFQCRQFSLRFASEGDNDQWRLGACRIHADVGGAR